jgi:hypothetical protein
VGEGEAVRALFFKLKCMKDFCSVVKVTMAILLLLSGVKPGSDCRPRFAPTTLWPWDVVVPEEGSCEMRKTIKRTTAKSAILDGCSTDLGKYVGRVGE